MAARIMPCVTEPVQGKAPSFHEDFQVALNQNTQNFGPKLMNIELTLI
jgi:hypothetical protein